MSDPTEPRAWGNETYSEDDRKAFAHFSTKSAMVREKMASLMREMKEMVDGLQDDFDSFIVPACKKENGEYKTTAHSSAFRDLEPEIKRLRAMINLDAA
jgi:hypothetical protein